MSAPNAYLVQVHGWPKGVTNVRIGDKFVYVGPVGEHVLYSSDEVPCQPGTILTVTEMDEVGPPEGASGASRLAYQLCREGRYNEDGVWEERFERWMYAKALARMINRWQLQQVKRVLHREAFGGKPSTFPDTPMDTPTPRPTPTPTPTPMC